MTTSNTNNFHILDYAAEEWSGVDSLNYGNIVIDDFVFTLDKDGRAIELEVRVLRESFKREE